MLLCLRLAGLLLTGAGGGAPAISWEAPAGCPDEMEVRAQVDALLAACSWRSAAAPRRPSRLGGV